MYHFVQLVTINWVWVHNEKKNILPKFSFFSLWDQRNSNKNLINHHNHRVCHDVRYCHIFNTTFVKTLALLSFGSVASPIVVGSINYSNTITSCQWLKGVIKTLQVLKNSAFANQYSRLEPRKIYTWPTKNRKQFCTTSIFIRPSLAGRDNGSLSWDLWVNRRLKIQKL